MLDENDNSPIFTLGDYESYIDEGDVRPDPPVTVLVRMASRYIISNQILGAFLTQNLVDSNICLDLNIQNEM